MPSGASRKLKLSELGEFGLINRLKKQMGPSPSGVCGIGDDAAVAPLSARKQLLFTTDMLVEGVHFSKTAAPASVGHKAVAASISDIAAMGGRAKYAVISLGVPKSRSYRSIAALYKGIRATARKYRVHVVGGDTVRSPKLVINVAMTGEAKKTDVVYRSGARAGDIIFVTGRLGRSLKSGRHLRFSPKTEQAQYLVKQFRPTAMIDVSDGLAADLGHICTESRVGAVLEKDRLPGHRRAGLNDILYGGEDFELLFTLPPSQARRLSKRPGKRHTFYPIGTITKHNTGLRLKSPDGTLRPLPAKGYRHF